MKLALIDSEWNVVQVAAEKFDVADDFVWVNCSDDCVAYLWTYNGHICVAPEASAPPVPDKLVVQRLLTSAVQTHLDTIARQRGYDGILSACTYATSMVPKFAAEGQSCVNWRDAVWSHCYQVMADVEAGTRAIPTPEELIAELPVMVWL